MMVASDRQRPFVAVRWLLAMMLIMVGLLAIPARAHMLPRQNATLNLLGDKGYLVISVPVSALAGADTNRDGAISPVELDRGRGSITAQFSRRFRVSSPDGPTKTGFVWIMLPDDPVVGGSVTLPSAAPSPDLVILSGVRFVRPPAKVMVTTDLFGSGADERQITLRARRGDEVDLALLTPDHGTHLLFRGAWAAFGDFIRTGITHILGGYDHLLFLMTIVVAGSTWRYWIGVITSFTLAHSVTLTLAAFGLVRLPSAVIEPAIACSILLMGALNLLGWGTRLKGRTAIVFACGLLHGLGFASALEQMGLTSQYRLATLGGFNLGVEIGQFAFLLLPVGLVLLGRRLGGDRAGAVGTSVTRGASALACLLAAIMLATRMGPLIDLYR
jgi:hydrogenase/urease accessory protein HupE